MILFVFDIYEMTTVSVLKKSNIKKIEKKIITKLN